MKVQGGPYHLVVSKWAALARMVLEAAMLALEELNIAKLQCWVDGWLGEAVGWLMGVFGSEHVF